MNLLIWSFIAGISLFAIADAFGKRAYLISCIVIIPLAALFGTGGGGKDLYDIYGYFARDYIADSLMAETIKGKTLGFATHIDVERMFYLETAKEYSYNGTFMLFGSPKKFTGAVKIICDEPRAICMKADFQAEMLN